MEFGAMVCTPKADCHNCPIKSTCVAQSEDIVKELPLKKKKIKTQNLFLNYCWVKTIDNFFLLKKRPSKGRFANFYEPPCVEDLDEKKGYQQLCKMLLKDSLKKHKPFTSHFTKYKAKWIPHQLITKNKIMLEQYEWIHESEFKNFNFVPKLIDQYHKFHNLKE
jgi:A/G-specific adenine glycosylase